MTQMVNMIKQAETKTETTAQTGNVTKRDIACRVSAETGLTQAQALAVVQSTLDAILSAVSQDKIVELRNFGVFEAKTHLARVGRNPKNPTNAVIIPARRVVKFTAGKEMREAVIQLPATEAMKTLTQQ
jgi:nucleoid DNA-binding protein